MFQSDHICTHIYSNTINSLIPTNMIFIYAQIFLYDTHIYSDIKYGIMWSYITIYMNNIYDRILILIFLEM